MATAESRADVVWEGGLASGGGRFTAASGALGTDVEVTWASRTDRSQDKTSPEELIAAAHASCFAMALSHGLEQAGNAPERLEVSAACTFDPDAGKITTMDLTVHGRVPGIDADAFEEAAQQAKEGCPVSGALAGNVDIRVDATLDGGQADG